MPRDDVAALFVEPRGVYASRVVDLWDAARDARRYDGPLPVVAHPPCGPWGRLRFLCRKQDPSCGPAAVHAVRRFGGVLEHPVDSLLWRLCALPLPGELPDAWGGRTYLVRQVAWGHRCEKPTWLYVVGVDPARVLAGLRTGGKATHRITSGPGGPRLPSASRKVASATPPAFADWLLDLAASARPPVDAPRVNVLAWADVDPKKLFRSKDPEGARRRADARARRRREARALEPEARRGARRVGARGAADDRTLPLRGVT